MPEVRPAKTNRGAAGFARPARLEAEVRAARRRGVATSGRRVATSGRRVATTRRRPAPGPLRVAGRLEVRAERAGGALAVAAADRLEDAPVLFDALAAARRAGAAQGEPV